MLYNNLGKTGIEVSKLCYGSLTLGPMQTDMSLDKGSELICNAFDQGVNFIDTAQSYGTYKYIRESLKKIERSKFVIFTKTYAYTKKLAEEALKQAFDEIGIDYIDGFLLHEQESEHTLRGHYEATEYFLKMKEKGYIRSFGISTHNIAGVKGAIKSGYVDVVHPLFNKASIGIGDGEKEEMYQAIIEAKNKGLGVYSMKPLGGGNLIDTYEESLKYVLEKQYIDSIAIGMQSKEEILANVQMFDRGYVDASLKENLKNVNRKLLINDWCIGCGKCVKRCNYGAIKLIENKAVVDHDKCILCTYCAKECADFCIKVI
ncbi:aldo/keto reductase [Proteocatella sphenisci]|uniref:aldo/keto reductase n=1 Tax=Proteocatella sphenisci TaxID=181070 RepID=UPI00048F28AE|nr:aldo/keto reductase [Proteocatella sphenisci]